MSVLKETGRQGSKTSAVFFLNCFLKQISILRIFYAGFYFTVYTML